MNLIMEITSLEGIPKLGVFLTSPLSALFTLPAPTPASLRISLGKERSLKWEYGVLMNDVQADKRMAPCSLVTMSLS